MKNYPANTATTTMSTVLLEYVQVLTSTSSFVATLLPSRTRVVATSTGVAS
jgi:hypothetical protein